MNRCVACINRRRFAQASGMRWPSRWLRVCYPHFMLRHARMHIAGRVALLLLATAGATVGTICLGWCIGFAAKVAAAWVGR